MEGHVEEELLRSYALLTFPVTTFFSLALLQRHDSVRTAPVICHFINRLWLLKIKMVLNEA